MKIHFISRELIKPSSPTPQHLRIHKFSLLDQLNPDNYIPAILFYSQTYKNTTKSSDHLKKSLAKTLTLYYPLAGHVKDDLFIDCDDYGSTFIEAHVACDMSNVLKQSEANLLENLLPCNVNPDKLSFDHTIIAIQVNYFECGGMAICFCFRHSIMDATAAANFIKSWATVACGGNDHINDVIFDYTSIFPPQDLSDLQTSIYQEHYSPLGDAITKRFVFDASNMAALREKLSNGPCLHRPTRFEAVSALIWGAVIAATRDTNDPRHVARISVNLGKRMSQPLPEHHVGNFYQVIFANWPEEKTIDYNCLAGKLRESITMVDDSYARKLNKGDGFLSYLRSANKINVFGLAGWCKLPFYEADFGWGKPLQVSTAAKLRNFAVLLDSSDGVGIEAWIGLAKKDMVKFEQDPNIIAYASFTPSI